MHVERKADQNILKQFQQPQDNQQKNQQQIQQGINNLLQQFSDMRLKRNITYLTPLESGIRLYSFRYVWDGTVQIGVMAQNLLANPVRREAVSEYPGGYYMDRL